jgi:hypothetical protein
MNLFHTIWRHMPDDGIPFSQPWWSHISQAACFPWGTNSVFIYYVRGFEALNGMLWLVLLIAGFLRHRRGFVPGPVHARFVVDSSWNVMAHGDARRGGGNWRMEWVASTLHIISEHGVSSITTAYAHTSAASSRLNWRPRQFEWTRPFRRKTECGFRACAITFHLASRWRTGSVLSPVTSQKSCVLTFTLLLLSYGQASEAWELANEATLFHMSGHSEQERTLTYLVFRGLTLILLTWRIWWTPNNASRWQMGFNSAFKGLSDFVINQVITIIIRFKFRNTNL